MEWKMFGMKGKLDSAKYNLFKVFRLISSRGEIDCDVSSPNPTSTVTSYEPVNPLAACSLEAELKKAQALMYQHMFDRAKQAV